MSKFSKKDLKAFEAAYDMLFLMKSNLDNIIAAEPDEESNDEAYSERCKEYIDWYQSQVIYKNSSI